MNIIEGGIDAPTRHPIDWASPSFVDPQELDIEMRRQFDICHSCRRCFNLCDSFPRLFDLIDNNEDELDGVQSQDFEFVVDGCTLCDMCFLTKCPYVPPHEFNIDFPHLMLRYRAANKLNIAMEFRDKQITEIDRNGKIFTKISRIANWLSKKKNSIIRVLLEKIAGIHRKVELPKYHGTTFMVHSQSAEKPIINKKAPAYGRKAVIFATCYINFHNPSIGIAALKVLAHNGVDASVAYPECCGMPQLEQGDIARTAEKASSIAHFFKSYIETGHTIITLVPSCTLLMKQEWPLIIPDNKDVQLLSQNVADISEYVVDISNSEGLADGLSPIDGPITLHHSCHSRAQNIGVKGAEMLRNIPESKVHVIERCSGHGGSWGVKKTNFPLAAKFAKKTTTKLIANTPAFMCSECPLAGKHLLQTLEDQHNSKDHRLTKSSHPIELISEAYKL